MDKADASGEKRKDSGADGASGSFGKEEEEEEEEEEGELPSESYLFRERRVSFGYRFVGAAP
ncbi:hypothetical protein CCMA1212_008029 [Trichoderma ghanense]|uniref:Uncharacterized protein n=1 Tax=Trichoderma ghanense TaxID=65468 RepID=A0ABY2GVJ6_9HYPO